MKKQLESSCPSDAPPCPLASLVGFAATKGFRSSRRAMRPVVGDTFITRRDGVLFFSQVDWMDETWIGIGRFEADSGEPLGFVRIGREHYPASILATLRMGCEFRPANANCPSVGAAEKANV